VTKGCNNKVLFVNLTSGSINEEPIPEEIYRNFVGGVGLGVRILYERMKPGVDPLGPDNMLGFVTGILTGTKVPATSRYTVVSKSPLTGTWGDANSGGYFGPMLKATGYDAVFFTGISPKPVYLLLYDNKVELRDATELWGKDTVETREILHEELGDPTVSTSCIGPAGESLSLLASIHTDRAHAAGRSGLGAVMGSKRLKAIAVKGSQSVDVANGALLKDVRGMYLRRLDIFRPENALAKLLRQFGTCGFTSIFLTSGVTPIKNWGLAGAEAFPSHAKIDGANITKYQVKKIACSGCPIACKGLVTVEKGPYAVSMADKPEYETIAGFGAMCLNDDIESIIKINDICNRYGIDTVSAGTAIAFAMECYERGIIGKEQTDGIELTWGNAPAIIAMLEKMVKREGFGALLADGVQRAAEKIGGGANEYAIHIHGEEPAYHDGRALPARGTAYLADATPGRHTSWWAGAQSQAGAPFAPYPELRVSPEEVYFVGPCYTQGCASFGLCFSAFFAGNFPLIEFVGAVTGWDFDVKEALTIGHRVQTLRQAFNNREGLRPEDFELPQRMAAPPSAGPLTGLSVDFKTLRGKYYEQMGWDAQGVPSDQTLAQLGLKELVAERGK
jgi:aldehyde:ferredoxin oxidoreductase